MKLERNEVLDLIADYRKRLAIKAGSDKTAESQLTILMELECDIRNLEVSE